jgi:gliding motility-associated-like protein
LINIEPIPQKAFYRNVMKKGARYLLLAVFLIFTYFCADAGYLKPVRIVKKGKDYLIRRPAPGQITNFSIPEEIAPEVIDQNNHIISIVVHAGQDRSSLTPTIAVSQGSTVTPASGATNDFTNGPLYTVDPNTVPVIYNVKVFEARTASACAGVPTVLTGDPLSIPFSFKWQILTLPNIWNDAPVPNSNSDYTTAQLVNNTTAPVVYTFRRQINNVNGTTYDSYTDVTVLPVVANNTIATSGSTTFCVSGDPGTITGSVPTGGDGVNYTYAWQKSENGGSFTPIPNTNSENYSPSIITVTTSYLRTVISGDCTVPLSSNPVTITIQNDLGNNTITPPSVVSFCETGSPVILGSSPTGGDNVNYSYQWQNSTDGIHFNNISGATHQDLGVQVLTETTWYQRIITSSGSCNTPSTSLTLKISVTPKITNNIITDPRLPPYCVVGNPGTITGPPPTGGNGPGTYSYKWQISTDGGVTYENPLNINNQKDYTTGILTQTTYLRRTASSGACVETSVSTPIIITVYKALANNTLTPPTPAAFCEFGNADPIIGLIPTGGNGSPSYQWQQSPDKVNAPFTNMPGQTGKDFDPPRLTTTMFYRRIVTETTCITPSISDAVEIHITPPITFSSIQSPPFSYCVSVDPETLSGSPPQGGDGGNLYQYQWYSSTDDGATWNPINTAIGIDYNPPTITQTTWFRRDATSGACQVPFPSNIAKIVVNQTPADVSVTAVAPICAGNKVTLSVIAPDPALTYIWYDTPTKDNTLFTGPAYITNVLTTTKTFYVEASNGTCPSPTLTSAIVTVNPLPATPSLVTNPISTCQGATATLDILNPQPGITYNWYTTATNGTPVFTNSSFTTPPVNAAITYYVEALNGSGCVSSTRTAVPVSPLQLPTVTATGANICPGQTATVTSDNTDPTVTINWYNTPTGGTSVSTGDSFTTLPVTANITYYAEAVSGNCVSATRSIAKVQLIQPLPAPVVSVEAAIAPEITFRWAPVTGSSGYQVSTDGGQTFTSPSAGNTGTTHTVSGLQIGQSVTLVVRAIGNSACALSNNSAPVTGVTINPLINQIFVANAFTPNGDGKNDIIYVHNENIKSLKFYVYDQWGEMLYTSQSQQNGWDGTFKGKTEPAGVYIYFVQAIMNDGQQVNKKGTITLIR